MGYNPAEFSVIVKNKYQGYNFLILISIFNLTFKYKLLCPRGTQTCALAVANIAHAVYLLDVAKRPIPQG